MNPKFDQKNTKENLDLYFENLEVVDFDDVTGKWRGGLFYVDYWREFFLKKIPFVKWWGKEFYETKKVDALIFSFFGLKFKLSFFGSAILEKIEFRNKTSVAIVYNHLPIIDNLRKIDENTLMGILELSGEIKIYFYLKKI
ncbi:DUF4334 domain-containing protein [Patescibacteria group bacterium]|nr:DUF4334 domain-containing protein [Patescibacteria group bacterium]MCG2695127.1 DUF4334 domain-containing protein [Candidatus Parcubacteria bacterium]